MLSIFRRYGQPAIAVWVALLLAGTCSLSWGAVFNVSTVPQFQSALTVAATNGQDDVINIDPGIYYVESPDGLLNFSSSEAKSLTLNANGGDVILDGQLACRGLNIYLSANNTNAWVALRGVTFRNCHVESTDSPNKGGGLFLRAQMGDITVENCVFSNNTAFTFLGGTADAGGAYVRSDSGTSISLAGNVFVQNHSSGTAGGLFVSGSYDGSVTLANNLFAGNYSTKGGGAYLYTIQGTLSVMNNTFVTNYTTGVGPGYEGGGAYLSVYSDPGTATLYNNIGWTNSAQCGVGLDFYVEDDADANSTGAAVNVFYNTYRDLQCHIGDHLAADMNRDWNPDLAADFTLKTGSPCIDAGTNLAWMSGSGDLKGNPRIVNGTVDMGACEYVLPMVNNDGGASNITDTSAVLNGSLVSTGASPASVKIFWGLTDGTTNAGAWTTNASFGNRAAGLFSTNITGLLKGSSYWYRCWASNSAGVVWAFSSTNFTTGYHTVRGTPISWMNLYGITNDYETADIQDNDRDGALTWVEYLTGTDPTNAASFFHIMSLSLAQGTNTVVWYATTNSGVSTCFTVYRRTNLVSGSWSPVASNVNRSATGTNTCSDVSPVIPSFYRIAIPDTAP